MPTSVLGKARPGTLVLGAVVLTPPGVSLDVTGTPARISGVSGKNDADFTLTSNEAFLAYEIKAVPDSSSPRNAGTLIESGGAGTTGVPVALDVTGAELLSAVGEGTYVIKVFVQDATGTWST